MRGYLLLEDGTTFSGRSVGAAGAAFGEAVFTTAMTGYQETVTDPSYAEQIVCFTAAMVGNYGVADARASRRPHAKAVLMRRLGGEEWAGWLAERGIVALDEIDTRALVLRLRSRARCAAVVVADEEALPGGRRSNRCGPAGRWRASARRAGSPDGALPFQEDGGRGVALVDYGRKRSILRRLEAAGAAVTVHPPTSDADELAALRRRAARERPRRPRAAREESRSCELLGRSRCSASASVTSCSGSRPGTTYKLRSAIAARTTRSRPAHGRVLVTSQNHGFAVDRPTPPRRRTSRSTTARSRASTSPTSRARSVQFHPEAGPGPHDAWPIIERWVEELRADASPRATSSRSA